VGSHIYTYMRKTTTSQFIERAQSIHGNYYDYSDVVLIKMKENVKIICPVHGDFDQIPLNHVRGSGCKQCGYDKLKQSTEAFIDHARQIHNNYYDYSNTELTGMNNKVTIICPVHGEFEQRAVSHIEGSGCSQCTNSHPHTLESFIGQANIKHDFKYNYGNVKYKNIKTKILITCAKHEDFMQTPSDHLQGYGCPECAGVTPVTTKEFVKKSNKIHNNKYNYDNVTLEGMNNNVIITCDIHGDFNQRPADHQHGVGCPECSLGKRGRYSCEYFNNFPDQQNIPGILYLVTIGNTWCKIGITKNRNTKERFKTSKVTVICEHHTTLKQAYDMEQVILKKFEMDKFRAHELRKENFSGWTECFPIKLLEEIHTEMKWQI